MKKIFLNKKIKIISVSILFVSVIITVIFLCLAGIKKEEKSLSSYDMELVYSDTTHTLSGTEKVTFINNYENMFTYLYLHLYPNAFRENAKNPIVSVAEQDKVYVNGESFGNINIIKVISEGQELNYQVEGQDENILKVELPFEVYPDESITFEIEFETILANVNHRLGYGNNTTNFGNFYPILCVYEDGIGFKTDLYHSNGDPFYSECANYNITLSYPSTFTLASSGTVTSSNTQENITTCKIKGEKIRDFCFVLSEIFEKSTTKLGDTNINYYGYNGDINLNYCIDVSKEALSTFNDMFGDYPYDSLNVVKTNFVHGGMEYPNLVMISDDISEDDIAYVIVHEIAHQWWYGVVGNDEYNHAWMDEGLAEYSTLLFFEKNSKYGLNIDEMIKKILMQNQKQKEVFNKIRKFIEENKRHEYRNGRINEYYLELNEKKLNELLNLLKEVE